MLGQQGFYRRRVPRTIGLVQAKEIDGAPFAKGKRVNSFTNHEHRSNFALSRLLESRLCELGARFEATHATLRKTAA